MKKITTMGGSLFLLWFLFSPAFAFSLYVRLFGGLPLFSWSIFLAFLLSSYALLGFIGFVLMKSFRLKFFADDPNPTKFEFTGDKAAMVEKRDSQLIEGVILPVAGLIIVIGLGWPSAVLSVIGWARHAPIFFLIASATLFVAVCFANWHKGLRKRVNYYLSGGYTNEQVAYAKAEDTLYLLNAVLIFFAGIVAIFSLIYLGL